MKYVVDVAGRTIEIELDGDVVRVDGVPVHARLAELPGTPIVLLTVESEVHRVAVARGDMRGKYSLSLDGRRYD